MRSLRSWILSVSASEIYAYAVAVELNNTPWWAYSNRVITLCILSHDTLVRGERSYIYPTRLETRTKESNMCASHWVLRNLKAKWKWKLSFDSLGVIQLAGATPSGHNCLTIWPRKSVHVGTRKMVNYAWAGWSQRKLWWRSVAVLTCKSIVKLGYRGERLIEPSSSWFPPKFPSG